MSKKAEFELPQLDVVMFLTDDSVLTTSSGGNGGGFESEDDWIDPENNTY